MAWIIIQDLVAISNLLVESGVLRDSFFMIVEGGRPIITIWGEELQPLLQWVLTPSPQGTSTLAACLPQTVEALIDIFKLGDYRETILSSAGMSETTVADHSRAAIRAMTGIIEQAGQRTSPMTVEMLVEYINWVQSEFRYGFTVTELEGLVMEATTGANLAEGSEYSVLEKLKMLNAYYAELTHEADTFNDSIADGSLDPKNVFTPRTLGPMMAPHTPLTGVEEASAASRALEFFERGSVLGPELNMGEHFDHEVETGLQAVKKVVDGDHGDGCTAIDWTGGKD